MSTEAHVAGCARCSRTEEELAAEQARLAADLPFDSFAAGVAERLARVPHGPGRPVRPARRAPWTGGWRAGLGAALAAALVAAVAVPVLRDRVGRVEERTKGAPALEVWVRERGVPGARALGSADPVPAGASLRVGLSAPARRFAALALVDGDGVTVLHDGPAAEGPLPSAFEWTGHGDGALVLVLDDAPVDAGALAERLRRGGIAAAGAGGRSVVVTRPLRRAAP
jgi:hypothetical protein